MSKSLAAHYVEVVEFGTNRVVTLLGPFQSGAMAVNVQLGANVNLDHDRYFTRLLEPKGPTLASR